MDDITAIKNYILFLKKECNLSVSLHPRENDCLISSSELIAFNIHENPHCIFVKTFSNAKKHCINMQKKARQKCTEGSFCGTCYAGVFEYVYPIYSRTGEWGFISVSGYKSNDYKSYIEKTSKKFDIPLENLEKSSNSLKSEIPDKKRIDTLIIPLAKMLELTYNKSTIMQTTETHVTKVINYINNHYTEDITLHKICAKLSCSRSVISHSFKKTTGQSFREYLVSLRLKASKTLLSHSKLSITEISYAVGFNDSNYFSHVFKSNVGVSPITYRKTKS